MVKKEKIKKIIKENIEQVEPEIYKVVLQLKLSGFKIEEVAEITGKTIEAIKNDYKRGQSKLEEILKRKGYLLK